MNSANDISTSPKLDLIIQLPYVTKSPQRQAEARRRRKEIERRRNEVEHLRHLETTDNRVIRFTHIFLLQTMLLLTKSLKITILLLNKEE